MSEQVATPVLIARIDAAINRITTGSAPMRVPAEPESDPDLVLAQCKTTIERQQKQLADCYRVSGADPDSNEDWRLAERAVDAARELRADCDAASDIAQSIRKVCK